MSTAPQQFVLYRAVVGRVIASHRARLGMQQPQLAAHLGINQTSLSRIETGQSTASVEQLAVLAHALRTTPGALLAEADHAERMLEAQGYKVVRTKEDAPVDWTPIGAVVLAGLLIALALGAKR